MGIYATNMDKNKENVLLMDLGTNGEMVIGNKHRLLATSCPAGPAFEGVNNRKVHIKQLFFHPPCSYQFLFGYFLLKYVVDYVVVYLDIQIHNSPRGNISLISKIIRTNQSI